MSLDHNDLITYSNKPSPDPIVTYHQYFLKKACLYILCGNYILQLTSIIIMHLDIRVLKWKSRFPVNKDLIQDHIWKLTILIIDSWPNC